MSIFDFAGGSGNGGEDFPDIIKVSVESRSIVRMDYDGTANMPTEITEGFKAVFDLENLETGWVMMSTAGPNVALAKIGDVVPPRPSDEHKAGFRVLVKLPPSC